MRHEEFNEVVKRRLEKIVEVLHKKGGEYVLTDDSLARPKQAAAVLGNTPRQALWGMAVKHLLSVLDLVHARLPNTEDIVDEKVGDLINYLIIFEALLREEREGQQKGGGVA